MSPWENITAELARARESSMLNTDVFYGQNQIDLSNALLQNEIEKEAQRIINDPALLEKVIRESGMSSDGLPDTTDRNRVNPLSIGIGARTDEIKNDALLSALKGLFTGGIGGAVMGGAKSYIMDTAGTLFDVNKDPDPIGRLNTLQRWTKAPVESRSGQTPAEIQAAIAREINQQAATRMRRQEGVGESGGGSFTDTPSPFSGASEVYGDNPMGTI